MKNIRIHIDKLLLVFCLVFSSIYIDWWPTNWNTASRAAMPLSIVIEGNLDIDEYSQFTGDKATINGHYYTDKGPSIGFLLTPVIFLTDLVYPLNEIDELAQLKLAIILGAILFGSIPFSLCAYWIFRRRFLDDPFGIPIVILFFFGSFLFTFSGSFYSHSFTAFLLLASVLSLEKQKFLISGLLIGLAFMTEYTTAIFGIGIGIWLIFNNRNALPWFILGCLLLIALQGLYNYVLTGSVLDFAYKYQENFIQNSTNYGFGMPSINSLYDISFSPYRGLFFFTPMLLLFFFAFKWKNATQPHYQLYLMLISISVAYILLFSMSKSWHGGWTFGPRYLYPLPVILFYLLTNSYFRVRAVKWTLLFLGIAGLILSFLNKATVLYPPTEYKNPISQSIIPAIENGQWNQMNLFTSFGLEGKIAFIIFSLLFLAAMTMLIVSHHKQLSGNK